MQRLQYFKISITKGQGTPVFKEPDIDAYNRYNPPRPPHGARFFHLTTSRGSFCLFVLPGQT